jgi:hypothetical protein
MRRIIKNMLSSGTFERTAPRLLRKLGKPLYLSVAMHTEHVQDPAVFREMLRFGEKLPFRAAAFVMTPYSPIIRKEMADMGVSEQVFTGRLRELNGVFELGMHGHFCRPRPAGSLRHEPARWIAKAGFEQTADSPAEIRAQFAEEYDYLSSNFGRPEIYSGGWWFLNSSIVSLLEEYGLRSDCTVRRGVKDSFGNGYMSGCKLPNKGRPFILPPAMTVTEFPSISYLYSDCWRILLDLLPMLAERSGPLFAVLPAHDHDLAAHGPRMLENIRLLKKIRNVKFVPFSAMLGLAQESGAIKEVCRSGRRT